MVAADAAGAPGEELLDDVEGGGTAVDEVADEEDGHGFAKLLQQLLEEVGTAVDVADDGDRACDFEADDLVFGEHGTPWRDDRMNGNIVNTRRQWSR